ncbi:hypothetical protein EDD37DRAFT_610040 [Exophiala viscosa]|uniref:DUF7587 domain-containing protein n=1 Tax=Exophiala viscosa TaxID=2486360 RepID=A0AAN6DRQ2_9EURO|nr:hypothetical protein EDD36DRAFT_420266 [Exophiala viscosa]KAI1623836.1 hypothetical protein EDD37DRAFT_610040 [Exophiala viscosa]
MTWGGGLYLKDGEIESTSPLSGDSSVSTEATSISSNDLLCSNDVATTPNQFDAVKLPPTAPRNFHLESEFNKSEYTIIQSPISLSPQGLSNSRSSIDLRLYSLSKHIKHMYRAVPSYPANHVKSGSGRDEAPQTQPGKCNSICARAPEMPATWENAYSHLTWQRKASPFVSFFTNFEIALRWKDDFLARGADRVRVFCFHTEQLESLLDAKLLADKLGITELPKVGTRHDYECLVWRWVPGDDCAGVYEFPKKLTAY